MAPSVTHLSSLAIHHCTEGTQNISTYTWYLGVWREMMMLTVAVVGIVFYYSIWLFWKWINFIFVEGFLTVTLLPIFPYLVWYPHPMGYTKASKAQVIYIQWVIELEPPHSSRCTFFCAGEGRPMGRRRSLRVEGLGGGQPIPRPTVLSGVRHSKLGMKMVVSSSDSTLECVGGDCKW